MMRSYEGDIDEEERVAKAIRCRDQALRELVETEKTYVNGLGKLIIIYMNPLKQDDCKIISIADHQSIFPSVVTTIYNLHNQLLAEFEFAYYYDTNTEASATNRIGKVLIKYAELFKMYQLYMNGYERSIRALQIIKTKNKRFNKWLQGQHVKTSLSAGNLESLLILPIQRIPRYQLLLREIIKQTQKIDERHNDLTDLNKTYHQILQITQLIESKMKEYDNKRKVAFIETKFDNIIAGDFIQRSRYFIYESKNKNDITIHKMDGSSYHIHLILFNDCLIYGHYPNDESMSISMHATFMKRKLHFDHLLPFDAVFKCVMEDEYKGYASLLIYSREYSVWISFQSKKLRAKWFKLITHANDTINNKHLTNLQKLYVCNKSPNEKQRPIMPYPCFVPDDYSDHCQECGIKFTYISNRKHHCKQCGRLLCNTCTNYRINSFNKYKRNQIIRCCKTCKHINTFSMISSQDQAKQCHLDKLCFDELQREKRSQTHHVRSKTPPGLSPQRSASSTPTPALMVNKSSTS
eukprot:275286_1